jgi:TorA maturation chaperone TorD
MGKRIEITKKQRAWLKRNKTNLTDQELADHIGCCIDTLRRILMREGLAHYDAAKYVVAESRRQRKWCRPCLVCGTKEERPLWQYVCARCKKRQRTGDIDAP